MTGTDLKRFRERRGLSRTELAELLNDALGKKYTGDTVSRWEREQRKIPGWVSTFLDETALAEFGGAADDVPGLEPDDRPLGDDGPGDTPPGPRVEAQPPLISGSGLLVTACTELFEMIGAGVGLIGAAVGNDALVGDGAIIIQDRHALGTAYGKLAETNETFRRMLVGLTEGGAWLQAAIVTGTTLSKCWQNHMYQSTRIDEPEANGHVEQPHEFAA